MCVDSTCREPSTQIEFSAHSTVFFHMWIFQHNIANYQMISSVHINYLTLHIGDLYEELLFTNDIPLVDYTKIVRVRYNQPASIWLR